MPTQLEIIATTLFALAILHAFSIKLFQHLALKYRPGSLGENLFHLLGEVEVVFGFWAGAFLLFTAYSHGVAHAIEIVESRDFTEPAFVFAVMAIAASRPILQLASFLLLLFSRLIPAPGASAFFLSVLIVGPLMGSLITEPAAMTVTALILKREFLDKKVPERFKYLVLAVLFVNISIGGVLTAFAAPPVLMVAGKWGWSHAFMATHFGMKAALAVATNAALCLACFFGVVKALPAPSRNRREQRSPRWLVVTHVGFLAAVVFTSHHPLVFLGIFLFFLGVVDITREHQDEIKLREALLVGFFLAGLVVLGDLQAWWLRDLLPRLGDLELFLGSTFLTGIVDNAALTYLGSQVTGISETAKYALLAGAVTGGGLTVIANAPNPAGFSILRSSFGEEGINPLWLFAYAVPPTIIAALYFWLLPF